VVGVSRSGDVAAGRGVALDLRDAEATRTAVRDAAPSVVYHLAALASVARSWEAPGQVLADNGTATLALLEAVRHEAPAARVVLVSSGEVYGPPERLPVDEEAPLRPQNPYAVSKVTTDLLGGLYADAYGLHLVRTRAFNHAGPGQHPIFVLSSLARQIAEARRAGASSVRLVTGNPEARRDFTDVRDVVRAYRLLVDAEPGVYNVCSGRAVSVAELVAMLADWAAPLAVEHAVDPALIRPHDTPEVRGSHARLTQATGWQPEIPLARTAADTVAWWEHELALAPVAPE
jgi:GDP-4-dehydro-6-deoxy-D-mannose reductase